MNKKFKFNVQALLGLGVMVACVAYGIYHSSSFTAFVNIPSFFITIGGTFGAMVVSFPLSQLKSFPGVVRKVYSREMYDSARDIATFVEISKIVRREGILSIENKIDGLTNNDFIKKGMRLLVDGVTPDVIRAELFVDLRAMQRRHKAGAAMLSMIARTAPSLGLLCTYVGLIPMLQSIADPETLGPLMAIELVSSFYGSFIAYIVFAPMANRLQLISKKESLSREMIIFGVTSIGEGINPHRLEDSMLNYMSEKEQFKYSKMPHPQEQASAAGGERGGPGGNG